MSGLAGLSRYPQFVVCRGKVPCTPFGQPGDAHDPANWMDQHTAAARATALGPEYRTGFVFTAGDPFFLIDLDNCATPEGGWSPLALALCEQFRGAAVEVSQSGRGLHIVGTAPNPPPHSCKADGFDLYTSRRFVALTYDRVIGDVDHECSPAVAALIASALPVAAGSASVAWTDEPVPEWSGPADDLELVARMLRSKSGASVFGGKASAADLWTADADALGACYPDDHGGRAFDHSAADAALCSHLAFWTGRDCARIDRLFRESALYRDKWERDDYRGRTVLGAVAGCSNVYRERVNGATAGPSPQQPAGGAILTTDGQEAYFAGCIYVRDLHRVFVPDGALLRQGQFDATYGGQVFTLDRDGTKVTRSAFEALTQSLDLRHPQVHAPCFRPELPPGALLEEAGRPLINTFVPANVRSEPGDVGPFLDLLGRLLPDEGDRALLLAYMAAVVQYPGVKFQWAPLVQGVEGNGKSALIRVLSEAVGWKYVHLPNAKELDNKFTGWLHAKLFIGVEEIKVKDRWEVMETLKALITNPQIEIQFKGADQTLGDNRANFLFCSNHKDAIIKGRSDRRYSVFYTAQQEPEHLVRDGMAGGYFPWLYSWLKSCGYARVTHWLRGYPIPDAINPATNCHRAPDTTSTEAALRASMGAVEQEILSAVEEERPGFRGGWVSSVALDRLIDGMRTRGGVSRNRRRSILKTLGYDYHPSLINGRAPRATGIDEARPRLYVVRGGPLWVEGANLKELMATYEAAQTQGG